MTVVAAWVAVVLALLSLLGRMAWQIGWPTPFDLNFLDMLEAVALVVLGASVIGHQRVGETP